MLKIINIYDIIVMYNLLIGAIQCQNILSARQKPVKN